MSPGTIKSRKPEWGLDEDPAIQQAHRTIAEGGQQCTRQAGQQ